MRPSQQITGPQLVILRSLWRRGEASVGQVHADASNERAYRRSTVATLLRRLEKRGLAAHRVEGREFHYHATVDEPSLRRSMVAELAERVFGGSVPELVAELLSACDVSAADLAEVRSLLERHERELAGEPAAGDEPTQHVTPH